MSKRTEIFDLVYKAAEHFQTTGKHKQVSFRYNPENRTGFDFSSWKHERDHDSVRKILVEDVRVSSEGMVYPIFERPHVRRRDRRVGTSRKSIY